MTKPKIAASRKSFRREANSSECNGLRFLGEDLRAKCAKLGGQIDGHGLTTRVGRAFKMMTLDTETQNRQVKQHMKYQRTLALWQRSNEEDETGHNLSHTHETQNSV
ncbi:hypothetical protein T265_09630 [Opisthorchis viverrini]|uniref:Uncharacterized protein n=1 Tax=Opisthorchis viverrini TaxID=6198 RepID=A0A074Z592_OPIVI|nr:hypothetical protein T265_09630 [Opisthorchis viverrini]KER22238.1 hypothetical protein T265_09630 [Opisthorchis viverrini]